MLCHVRRHKGHVRELAVSLDRNHRWCRKPVTKPNKRLLPWNRENGTCTNANIDVSHTEVAKGFWPPSTLSRIKA